MINHIKNFLLKTKQWWYNHYSILYHIDYLYYELPGTGKSNFVLTLVGKFNLIIYKLTLNDSDLINDHLKSLFDDMSDYCILLIKDINVYNIVNKRFYISEEKGVFSSFTEQKRLKIILSGLFIALNGVALKNDRFLIMITNHLKKLNNVLIWSNQIDKWITFNLLKKQGSYDMFIQIYCEVCQFCNWT